jgi:histidinol-phosphatase
MTAFDELLSFALELAHIAEREILPRYRRCAIERTADGSEVTDADRRAEAAVRDAIGARHPTHAILGEEYGAQAGTDARHRWVIDPLDGTTWFSLGMPLFGTLIALLEDDEPVVGVIHMPVLGETVYAARGLGCWFRSAETPPVRIRVGTSTSLDTAIVSASGVHASDIAPDAARGASALTPVIRGAAKFRFCGDCLQHALVARGTIHAAIDTVMQPWDIAAIVPCIEEAGGVVSSLSGERQRVVFGGSLLSSCDAALHAALVATLAGNRIAQ